MHRPRNPRFTSQPFEQHNVQSHSRPQTQSNTYYKRSFSRPRSRTRSRGRYYSNTSRYSDQQNYNNQSSYDVGVAENLTEKWTDIQVQPNIQQTEPNFQQRHELQNFYNNPSDSVQKQDFSCRSNANLPFNSFNSSDTFNSFNPNRGQVQQTVNFDDTSYRISHSSLDKEKNEGLQDDVLFFKQVQEKFPLQQTQIPGLDSLPDNAEENFSVLNSVKGPIEQNNGGFSNTFHSQVSQFSRQEDRTDFQTKQISLYGHPGGTSMQPKNFPPPPPFLCADMQHNTFQQSIDLPQSNQFHDLPQSNRFPAPPQTDFGQRGFLPPVRFPHPQDASCLQQVKGQLFQPNVTIKQPPIPQKSHSFQHVVSSRPMILQNQSQPFEEEIIDKNSTIRTECDMQWINDWLIRKVEKKMRAEKPVVSTVNVCEVQEKTTRMMFLMASLQKQIRLLSSCDENQFEEGCRTVTELKREMETIKKYLSAINLEEFKTKVKKRAQKRERLKRQRQEKYKDKQRTLERRQQLHREIDDRLNKIYQKDADKRQQKELKKQADKILSEVRKKTQDVTRATDLLKNLQKLRKLRKDRLLQQGVHTKPEAEEDFEDKVKDCLKVLKQQKEVYSAENKALRVMLETEQEENKEKEREKKKLMLYNQEMKKQKKEESLLFGEPVYMDMNDPMYVFRQYYNQANLSMESLIQIRCDWDRFFVSETTPGGSRIPDGFVIPVKPFSDVWASALKEET